MTPTLVLSLTFITLTSLNHPSTLHRRPLYKPCKCSGSIGLTHQDCLQSWLQVQRGSGACELCKTPFRFSPQYAENAPDRLPALQVFVGLARRILAKWLPFILRILFAASLWLIVAPLVTAYLYHGWMNRPSVVMERFSSWQLLTTDLVSGAIVAAFIIVSFLSLMSFGDFLRLELQQQHRGLAAQPARNNNNEVVPAAPREEDIDNGVWLYVQQEIVAHPRALRGHNLATRRRRLAQENDESANSSNRDDGDDPSEIAVDSDDEYDEDDGPFLPDFDPDYEDDTDEGESDEAEEEPAEVVPDARAFEQGQHAQPRPQENNRNDQRIDRPFDFEAEENVDVDINIALDELLGVRGPLVAVIRNLLWLLAFNAVYIGFFCFVPRTVGSAVCSLIFNTTEFGHGGSNITEAYQNLSSNMSISNILKTIDAESEQQQTVFRFNDFATVTFGYLACAAAAWISRLLWLMSQRIGFLSAQGRRTGHGELDEMREVMDEMNRIVNVHMHNGPQLEDDPPGWAVNMTLGFALEAMMAVVKVGVLLFLKMFLLPILLGLCLDISVASVFGFKIEDRVAYTGGDLFSSILLHWICGITFMLLVTVSVLQLREVAHPDLLSQIIRPQEPQPDLLGNLMHESVSTHAKRMALSLVIYALLWAMHVYFPVHILGTSGILSRFSFLELKLAYLITPKLQVPFELLFFHLCMLGLLERYKNGLGEMQHHWLKFLTGLMSIRESVLPEKVQKFQYVGTRAVFQDERVVDPFWYELARGESPRDSLIETELAKFECKDGQPLFLEGITKDDGRRVLSPGSDFIRLPYFLPGRAIRSRSTLLPTQIGRYRLFRDLYGGNENVIHLWREVPEEPIPRPPEGWDDLGIEPPDVQGRWAYADEKKSAIERGVAWRQPFFRKDAGWIDHGVVCVKLFVLGVLSWVATTLLLCSVVLLPPGVGRFLYFLLRVPDKWVHDPLGFAVGFMFTFPVIAFVARAVVSSDEPLWRRITGWISRFRFPPTNKAVVLLTTLTLWFGLAPLFLGITYDMAFVKSIDWFLGREPLLDAKSVLMDWATGTLLMYVWSFFCIRGVLTRRFRVFVVEGREIPEDDNPANAQAAAWHNAGDGRIRLTWQGNHGRIARFWDVLNAVVIGWEFNKVDAAILLHDVAVPVTLELFWTMIIPFDTVMFIWWFLPNLLGLTRAIVIRLLIAIVCCTQVARVWREQLLSWFEFAHKSARDDLFLVGEVLMNHDET